MAAAVRPLRPAADRGRRGVGAGPPRAPATRSPESLGQAFNFDLLSAPWDAATGAGVIDREPRPRRRRGAPPRRGCSPTTTSIRHPTRYGHRRGGRAAEGDRLDRGFGVDPEITVDDALGARRARAATMLMLALPGSAYLYQGEELGLLEVAGIDAGAAPGPDVLPHGRDAPGRDGCRVPLPWTREPAVVRLRPPTAPRTCRSRPGSPTSSVDRECDDDASSLDPLPPGPAAAPGADVGGGSDVGPVGAVGLHVVRAGGWHCLTNFGADPVPSHRATSAGQRPARRRPSRPTPPCGCGQA